MSKDLDTITTEIVNDLFKDFCSSTWVDKYPDAYSNLSQLYIKDIYGTINKRLMNINWLNVDMEVKKNKMNTYSVKNFDSFNSPSVYYHEVEADSLEFCIKDNTVTFYKKTDSPVQPNIFVAKYYNVISVTIKE